MEAAQRNVLADYDELYQLRNDVKSPTKNNLKSTLGTILDQLADPLLRAKIFTIADALIRGTPIAVSSDCGGDSPSNLRWDGRRPDEEAYRRRCLMFAMGTAKKQNEKNSYRR